MFVTIDKEAMRVMHAHEDSRACSWLAYLELPHVSVAVVEVRYPKDLDRFTDYELQLLYKNSTGQPAPGYFRPHVLRAVAAAILAMPQVDVDFASLKAQCEKVSAHVSGRYRYIKGAGSPLPVSDLFELPATLSSVTDTQELEALGAALAASVPAEPEPPVVLPTPAAPRAAKAAPSAPGVGSVTERIFAVCDEEFKRLNGLRGEQPAVDLLVQVLKDARNAAVPRLVEAGVNINSARKGSAMWLQSRSQG